MTPFLPDRVREHEQPHVRAIATQTLDALLRIEELLLKLIEAAASVPQATVVEPEPETKPAPKTTRKSGVTRL